jgi:cell division protein FtsI/penicillin-binding protein 2
VFVAFTAALMVLELRMIQLQVTQSDVWARESQRSTMRFESLSFERGWILDRHGEPLARTEQVRDLLFRFRDWRRESVSGQVHALLWLLEGERRSVRDVHLYTPEELDQLGGLRVADIASVRPSQRRRDAQTYLGWLFGSELGQALALELAGDPAASSLRVSDLPGWPAGRVDVERRADVEHLALLDLARVGGVSMGALLEGMDDAVRHADERVARFLARGEPPKDLFKRTRDLHAEFDNDMAVLAEGVPYDGEILVAVRGDQLPGFSVRRDQRRVYPERVADVAATLIGRTGDPNPADIDQMLTDRVRLADLAALEDLTAEELDEYEQLRIRVREIDYAHTDERGRTGIELAFEDILRGKRGWVASTQLLEQGVPQQVESMPPQRGLNVTLTLDAEMQAACEDLLNRIYRGEFSRNEAGQPEHWTGAIAIVDPRRGHVLALASGPNPTRRDMMLNYNELKGLVDQPLRNRALDAGSTGNQPPPGSTFKPIAALAALASGLIEPSDRLLCDGKISVGTQRLGCLGRHGEISLHDAITRSCNLYFYRLADRVGGDVLRAQAERFGLAQPQRLIHGNEVLAERGIPTGPGVRDVFKRMAEGPFERSEAMRIAIGQAPLDDVTPLQVAVAFGAIGTGVLYPPTLVAAVEGYGPMPPRQAQPLGISEADLDVVRNALAAVVDSPRGTAHRLHALMRGVNSTRGLPMANLASLVAGKTGTPEVDNMPDHSWFAGYLPREKPRLAFSILLEHTGEHGGDACVPVLAELLRYDVFADWLVLEDRP